MSTPETPTSSAPLPVTRKVSPVTQVVAIGIGAALFFVLSRFVAIPVPVPNLAITFQYALLAVLAVLYGPYVAGVAGFVGHILADATGYGIWLSWEIPTAVFGLIVGFFMLRNRVNEGEFPRRDLVRFNLAVIVGHFVAWGVLAWILDVTLMGEPFDKVIVQGLVAFVTNAIFTCVFGSIILALYAKTRTRSGSLEVGA